MYKQDKVFAQDIHSTLSAIIYSQLGWQKKDISEEEKDLLVREDGINQVFTEGNTDIFVNERYRNSEYVKYGDFTLRYRRENSTNLVNNRSEFFKTKANYLVYGIVNSGKTDFLKAAVINLKEFFRLIDRGFVVIDETVQNCVVIGEILHVPLKHNKDKSSSFIAVDIPMLSKFPNVLRYNLNF